MTVEEMLEEADDAGFVHVKRSRKLRLLNGVYADIAAREAWPWLEKETTLTITAGDASPTLPADFGKVISLVTNQVGALMPERLDYVTKTYINSTETGEPHTYFFLGYELRLYPTPSANGTARLKYAAIVLPLDEESDESDILLPARHHDALMFGFLSRLHLNDDDIQLASTFNDLYEGRILQMTDDLWMRQYDRSDRIYVVDDE